MFEAQSINADHKDLIHDVAYDFYGERMATCSSDQCVKVWDSDARGNWQLSANWKAHSGSVWKITWAHPEFGQVIATCSFDRTAAVWEEVGDVTVPGDRGLRQWVRRTNLVDSRTSVTDVKFGPKNLGLLLVTSSADGIIRIYEAPDVMNLAQWTLQHEIPTKVSISCLTWNPSLSRSNPPMIAVGSDEPNMTSNTLNVNPNTISPVASRVFLYEYSEASRRWIRTDCLPNIVDPVHDLAFSPNLGRSFHLLAIATKDVRIVSIKPIPDVTGVQNGSGTRFECETIASFDDHFSSVWRVSWNVTGTILASSGDDGFVRLWKMQYLNQWKCVASLKGDGTGRVDSVVNSGNVGAPPMPPIVRPTTQYMKLGTITNPNQVPWH